MLADVPLYTFDLRLELWYGRWYLIEWCVWWSGFEQIVEMVEIEGDLNGYVEEK